MHWWDWVDSNKETDLTLLFITTWGALKKYLS